MGQVRLPQPQQLRLQQPLQLQLQQQPLLRKPQLPAHLESLDAVFSEEVVRVRPPQRLQLKLQQLAKVASLDGDCSEITVQQPHQPQLQPQLRLQPQPQPQPRLLQPLQPIVAVSLVE